MEWWADAEAYSHDYPRRSEPHHVGGTHHLPNEIGREQDREGGKPAQGGLATRMEKVPAHVRYDHHEPRLDHAEKTDSETESSMEMES